VVSATVATRERLGEFALLRALGLSGRQLSLWLAIEHTFLLVAGLFSGLGLGALLAWLVLPFATLTSTGAAVTPPPTVVIPLASLLPILVSALAVLLATLLVLRRQLLAIRIGDVLRAQEE
jgi:ABC-type antimicrobial peptide transport system permease subunit